MPKTYHIMNNVGAAKYVVNFHDGRKTHPDGSPFFDIRIFKNKRKLSAFVSELEGQSYTET